MSVFFFFSFSFVCQVDELSAFMDSILIVVIFLVVLLILDAQVKKSIARLHVVLGERRSQSSKVVVEVPASPSSDSAPSS